jgi:hypothetical protein
LFSASVVLFASGWGLVVSFFEYNPSGSIIIDFLQYCQLVMLQFQKVALQCDVLSP